MRRRSLIPLLGLSLVAAPPRAATAEPAKECERDPDIVRHLAAWSQERPPTTSEPRELPDLVEYIHHCRVIAVKRPDPEKCPQFVPAHDFCSKPLEHPSISPYLLVRAFKHVSAHPDWDPCPDLKSLTASVEPARGFDANLPPIADIGVGWQDAVIRGLAAFVAKRARATVTAYLLEQLRTKVCGDDEVRSLLTSSCIVLAAGDPYTAPLSWQVVRAALIEDLRQLPLRGLVYLLRAAPCPRDWLDSADVLVASARLLGRLRRGDDAIKTIIDLHGDISAFDPNWRQSPGKSALVGMATLVGIVRNNLAPVMDQGGPVAIWKPTRDELEMLVALTHQQMSGTFLATKWRARGLANVVDDVELGLLRLESLLVAMRHLPTSGAELGDGDRAAYRAFALAVGQWLESVGRLLPSITAVSCRKSNDDVACVQAAFKATSLLAEGYEAARAGDFGLAYLRLMTIVDLFVAPEQLPAWLRTYMPFFISVATASSAADMEKALESFAAPPGSYLAKRRTVNRATRIVLNAYVGAAAGGEIVLADKARPGGRLGPFVPIGLEISRSLPHSSSVGMFISVIDVGALLDYRFREEKTEGEAPLQVAPKIGFAQVISPGLFAVFGLGKSPLSLGLGGALTPQLRQLKATEATETTEPITAFRFGAFLAVDIPLFFLR